MIIVVAALNYRPWGKLLLRKIGRFDLSCDLIVDTRVVVLTFSMLRSSILTCYEGNDSTIGQGYTQPDASVGPTGGIHQIIRRAFRRRKTVTVSLARKEDCRGEGYGWPSN